MWFSNKRVRLLELENEQLKQRVKSLQTAIDEHNEDVRTRSRIDLQSSSFSVDFDDMQVCSIERVIRSGSDQAVTVLGHYRDETKVSTDGKNTWVDRTLREWTLYCSHEEHQRLVSEFNEWKAKKVK